MGERNERRNGQAIKGRIGEKGVEEKNRLEGEGEKGNEKVR